MRHDWQRPCIMIDINKTNICLISKIEQPVNITQFRPISLFNTIYKVISRVVVERLKPLMAELVSPFQTGFVPGRSIHEKIMITKEVMHSMQKKRGKNGLFAIKIDLTKVYDKLNWEFIWRILEEIGLLDSLINVVMHGVTTVETNIN